MPGLHMLGRKYQFGADDMTIPAVFCSLSRITWVVLLSIYWTRSLTNHCNTDYYTDIALFVYTVTFVVYALMLFVSTRGTVLDVESRACMPTLLQVLFCIIFLETGLTCWGTYMVTNITTACDDDQGVPFDVLTAVVVGSWIDLSFTYCCGFLAIAWSTEDDGRNLRWVSSSHPRNGKPRSASRRGFCWGEQEVTEEEEDVGIFNHQRRGGGRSLPSSSSFSSQAVDIARNDDRSTHGHDEESGLRNRKASSNSSSSRTQKDTNGHDAEKEEEEEEGEDRYEFDSDEERQCDSIRPVNHSLTGGSSAPLALATATPLQLHLQQQQQQQSELESSDNTSHPTQEDELGRTPTTWSRRCVRLCNWFQCFTCGLFGGVNGTGGPDAFQQVAIVIAGWFKNLDLIPSDIVAALFLMRAEQRDLEAKAVERLLRERMAGMVNLSRSRAGGSRAFTHVGRWMWASRGVNDRASSRLHAQQIRESRDARRVRRDHDFASGEDSRHRGQPPPHAVDTDDEEESSSNNNNNSQTARNSPEQIMTDLDPEAREVLLFAQDMAPYMLGMYGYLLFAYMHGIRGWMTICCRPLARFFTRVFSCLCCCCSLRRSRKTDMLLHPTAPRSSSSLPASFGLDEGGDHPAVAQFVSPAPTPLTPGQNPQGGRLFALGDTCCEWNTTALVESAGRGSAAAADVVYASFTSFVGQTVPYCVCVDHAKRRVIIAVRGTFSIADAITDWTMVPASLAEHARQWGFQDEVEPDSHAHGGILKVAAWMRHDLQRQDILHRLFGISVRGDGDPGLQQQEEEERGRARAFSIPANALPDCRGYGLELTGHSLGAGIAIVLSLFLRPVFPNVRCMAFSPPGCIFDFKLAQRCNSWVYCVFVGKDFAARMSWYSLFKLRGQILDTLRRSKANKTVAMASALTCRSVDKLLYKSDQVPDTPYAREMERKIDELASRNPTILEHRLYMPGKILHIIKDETVRRNCCLTEAHYVPMWIDDRSNLDEILLSSRMVVDHFPDVVDLVLKKVIKEFITTSSSPSSSSLSS